MWLIHGNITKSLDQFFVEMCQRMENAPNRWTVDMWPFCIVSLPYAQVVKYHLSFAAAEFERENYWPKSSEAEGSKGSLQVTWSPGPWPITVLRCLHSSYGNPWIKTFYTTHIQVIYLSDVSQSEMTRTLKLPEYWLNWRELSWYLFAYPGYEMTFLVHFFSTQLFFCRFLEIPRMLRCCLGFPRGQWVHFLVEK